MVDSPAAGQVPRHPAAPEGAAGVSRELAAAVVPEQMLQGDEEILLLTKPSPLFIVLTSLRFMLVVVLLGVLVVRLGSGYINPNNTGLVAALACLGRLIWGLLVWTSHTYMLTNRRIVTIKGVINVVVTATPLRKVQRTMLLQPLWERIFGLGTIGIATAATETFDATWVMLARSVDVHERMLAAIRKAQ